MNGLCYLDKVLACPMDSPNNIQIVWKKMYDVGIQYTFYITSNISLWYIQIFAFYMLYYFDKKFKYALNIVSHYLRTYLSFIELIIFYHL